MFGKNFRKRGDVLDNYEKYDETVHRSRRAKKGMKEVPASSVENTQPNLSNTDEGYISTSQAVENVSSVQTTAVNDGSSSMNPAGIEGAIFAGAASVEAVGETSAEEYAPTNEAYTADETAVEPSYEAGSVSADDTTAGGSFAEEMAKAKNKKKEKKKNKTRHTIWRIIKWIILIGIICGILACGAVFLYVGKIIKDTPEVDTSNVYSLLSQTSTIYDMNGDIIEDIFSSGNRTLMDIQDVPDYTKYAFIALEDKTFETHHGFNVIRIFGAIKEAILNHTGPSGTSTITQQLARNLFLSDTMTERSYERKIKEAYIAYTLEKKMTKDEILETYLNTVNFGDVYGVQTAAQAYFSKDISEVTIAESALLAAIPQLPNSYKPILMVAADSVTEDTEGLVVKGEDYAYVLNEDGRNRMLTCLKLMHEQGYITDEEYAEAKEVQIADMVNPNTEALTINSNYFADYVIGVVIADLQEEYGYDYSEASSMVYNGGLNIYTTLDPQAQSVVEKEFDNNANFPQPVNYTRDSAGNILNKNGGVLLYAYSNYISSDNTFKLKSDEYKMNDDGSLTIYAGKRLAIYNTTVQGETDYSVEFKSMYTIEGGYFYSIPGGYLNIPQKYKSRDGNDNLVVSADFFTDYPDFFVKDGDTLSTKGFSLKQKTIQPQSAMTIIDNETGAIRAMIGGRQIEGRMLFNRAVSTRQPGSSIKPLAVYSAALQRSYELEAAGEYFPFVDNGYDTQGDTMWGDYLTAASIVNDEPTRINGKIWPKNSYNGYRGLMTFRVALQQSVNVCAVKILSQVGVDYSYDTVERYGITSLQGDSDKNLAALGMGGMTVGVSTLEMASAYTTFVNDGVHKSYSCYTSVTNRSGDTILEPNITETEVLNSGVAWIMRDILQTVVSEGIGKYAYVSGEKVGGKTGTTSDSYDIWFDGFTANYSASIWIGNDVNIKLSSMSPMAATLWGKIIAQCNNARGGTYSGKPDNVVSATIDLSSGLLSTGKGATRTEYFTKGTEPTRKGSLYSEVLVCAQSGYLATPACPETETVSVIQVNKKKDDDSESKVSGGKGAPRYYCNLHNPDPSHYPTEPGKKVTIVDTHEEEPDPVTDNKNDGKDNDKKTDKDNGTPAVIIIDEDDSDNGKNNDKKDPAPIVVPDPVVPDDPDPAVPDDPTSGDTGTGDSGSGDSGESGAEE